MARIGKYFILPLLLFPLFTYGQRNVREAYIQKYKDIAIRQMNLYKIPASIILAQACLESANGTSRLAVKGNNHFGIKCNNWKGRKIYHDDDKKGECFRKYTTAEDSFKDHSDFLRNSRRYSSLFDLDPKDYKGWAYGLKAAGYATDKRYPQLLIEIIEDYQLYKYDSPLTQEKGGKMTERRRRRLERKEAKAAKVAKVAAGMPFNGIRAESISREELFSETVKVYSRALKRVIYKNNGVSFIIATGAESYRELAKEYNLFTGELLKFNDLENVAVNAEEKIEAGSIVYIARKKCVSKSGNYTVKEGDTPYSISQKAGIRLKSLCKLNRIGYDSTLVPGTRIKLKKR